MKKLTCHCGGIEIQVRIPEEGFKNLIKLYQYHTKTAKHYFCSNCGIHTHSNPRINPKIWGINVACVEGINPFELKNVSINDGENHPLDKKK